MNRAILEIFGGYICLVIMLYEKGRLSILKPRQLKR